MATFQRTNSVEGGLPDIVTLTSPAFADRRTKADSSSPDDEKVSVDDEEYNADKEEKDRTKTQVEGVDEEGVRWAGGDEILQAKGSVRSSSRLNASLTLISP